MVTNVPEAARRGQPKCYRVYHHRDRPCEDCQVQEVFATGQPRRLEKINPLDGRTLGIQRFSHPDESGQVILVAEHVRDITEAPPGGEGPEGERSALQISL